MVAYAIICIGLMTAVWIVGEDEILRARSPYWSSSLGAMGLMLLPALALLAAAMTQGWRSTYDIAFCAIWIAVALFTVSSIGIKVPYLADAYALALSVWVMSGRRPRCKEILMCCCDRVQVMSPACLRGVMTAGPDVVRGSGPNHSHGLDTLDP